MTNPNNAIGTNAAYGTRTTTNAFNDFLQLASGRGVLSGWACTPVSGMKVQLGGVAGTRDVAIAEDNLGNRTTINNRSGEAIEVTIAAASASSNRYDAIVAYVKNPAQATAATPIPVDAPSVCGLIDVQGGTTGVSEAQIRAAITADGGGGTTAYYVVLATVYVASGTTTITSGNISQESTTLSPSVAGVVDYSSSEVVIGDWLGSGKVCRKVFTIATGPAPGSNVEITMPTGTDQVISVKGWVSNGSFSVLIAAARNSDATVSQLGAWYERSTNKLMLESSSDRSSMSGYVIVEYIK